MAEREQDLSKQAPQLHLPEGASLQISDGTNMLELRKDSETLSLELRRGEQPLFSLTVSPDGQIHQEVVLGDSRVHQVFDAHPTTGSTGPTMALETRETRKPPEYPPITIEGFAGRQGSYRDSDIQRGGKEYYVYLYYRPTPDEDWGFTIPYHIHFFGEKAEELKRHKIGGGARLRVSGELHTRQITGKQGEAPKTRYDVYANDYEIIRTRPQPMPGETRRRA